MILRGSMATRLLTALTVVSTLSTWVFSEPSNLKPATSSVMFWMSDEKKATSKFSLKAMSWKAVRLLAASLAGGGALDNCPSATTWMAAS